MSDKLWPTRHLGSTGLSLSEIGFGTAPLGNLFRPIENQDATAALEAAWTAGIRYFDTAPFYGFGLSERRVGDFLRAHHRDSFILSTKVGRLLVPAPRITDNHNRHGFCSRLPFEPEFDYSYGAVMRSLEDSLQRLGIAHIDVALIHDIGAMTHGDDNAELFKTCMEGGYRALDELRSQGVIGAVGLGVNEYEVCTAAMDYGRFDCFLVAGRYTLLEQGILDNLMPACSEHGASLIIGGPFNSGVLASGTGRGGEMRYDYAPAPSSVVARVRQLESICGEHGVSLPAAALQFPLAHPIVASVIPGLNSINQVSQAITYAQESIPLAFWDELKTRGLLREDAPTPGAQQGTD